MRIWSVHPRHLDRAGLVACWRESLLAQAVLAGRTKGYRNHPQLTRFRADTEPMAAIGGYLAGLEEEARRRGYRFDASRILVSASDDGAGGPLDVTRGQLEYEWAHLGRKLAVRSPDAAAVWAVSEATAHPLFRVVPGEVETWERP